MSEKSRVSLNLLLLFAMFFISLRGLVVLLLSNLIHNVSLIYWSAGALFYLLGAIGLYKLDTCNVDIPNRLKQLLYINFFLITYWVVADISMASNFSVLNNYLLLIGLAPFSLVLLRNLSEKSIMIFLAVVTFVISSSVLYDFAQLNNFLGLGNFDTAILRHELLRPSSEALGKSNNLYRPIGLLGPLPHNASQINSTLAVYWFLLLFKNNNFRSFMMTFVLFACSLTAAILALVTSNIIAMFLGLTLGLFMLTMHSKKNTTKILPVALTIAAIIIPIAWFCELDMSHPIIKAVTLRANSNTGDWENILDWRDGSLTSDSLAFLFGHSASMGSRMGSAEIGLVALTFQFGIFIALPFIYWMSYPVLRFALSKVPMTLKRQCIPEVMAILTGVLTMWHYKSLLQVPNMIIFLVIYMSAIAKIKMWGRLPARP